MSATASLAFPAQGYRPDLWYYFITVLATMYFRRDVADAQAFGGLAGGMPHVELIAPDPASNPLQLPEVKVAIYEDWVVLVIQGTTDFATFVRQAVPDTKDLYPVGGGLASHWYLVRTLALYDQIKLYVGSFVSPSRRLVVCGHSYGAALATLIAPLFARDYPGCVEGVFAMGSTRCGDTTFAANYTVNLLNVQNEDDPIPSWPPSSFGVLSTVIVPFGLAQASFWDHAGRAFYLKNNGDVYAFNPLVRYDSENLAVVDFDDRITPLALLISHSPGAYAQNVRVNLPLDADSVAGRTGIKVNTLDIANVRMAENYGVSFSIRSRL